MGEMIGWAELKSCVLDDTEAREHLPPRGGAARRRPHEIRMSRSPAVLPGAIP